MMSLQDNHTQFFCHFRAPHGSMSIVQWSFASRRCCQPRVWTNVYPFNSELSESGCQAPSSYQLTQLCLLTLNLSLSLSLSNRNLKTQTVYQTLSSSATSNEGGHASPPSPPPSPLEGSSLANLLLIFNGNNFN